MCKISNKIKRFVITCMFECFQSHCHILKELHEFLCMMSAITIFEESGFIFSFASYGLVTKSFGIGCTFEEVAKKTTHQKMNVNLFTTKLDESSHLVSRRQNPLKLLYSIMIRNTISSPYYKVGPTNDVAFLVHSSS